MSDTVERTVVISLKLAADPKSKATAEAVASLADSVTTAGMESYAKMNAYAEKTMAAITEVQSVQAGIRVDLDIQENSKRIDASQELLARLVALEEKRTEAKKTEDQRQKKLDQTQLKNELKDLEEKEKALKEHNDKLKKAEESRVASQQKANESAVVAIQVLADMTEAAAKMGLVSEDNSEKFARKFLIIQDGVRFFKGLTDVIWKTTDGLIELGTTTLAQVAKNELLAASNTKVGATAGAASAVAATGSAVTATTSAVAAGTGTAVGAGSGVAAIAGAKVVAVMALAAAELFVVAGVLAEALQAVVRGITGLFGVSWDWTESITMAIFSYRDASEKNEENEKKVTEEEKRRLSKLDSLKRFEDRETKVAGYRQDLTNADNVIAEAKAASTSVDDPKNEGLRDRIVALRDVRAAENAILDDRKKQEERLASGQFQSSKNRERVTKMLEDAQARLLTAEKNRLRVIQSQKKAVEDQLKSEREKLQVAKDATKTEKQRLLEQYGRLSAEQKSRVNEISSKKASGKKLSRQDNELLDEVNFAGDITSNYYANQGIKAGGNQAINNLGLLDSQKAEEEKARAKEAELQEEKRRLAAQEDQRHAAVIAAAERQKKIVSERITHNADAEGVNLDGLPELDQSGSQVKEIERVAAEASDNITQQSMEVSAAIGTALDAMTNGLDDLKRTIEKRTIKEGAYRK